ncbi:MAG: hypothetical protein KF823_01115 [Xanthomonadales bacterium]|nr:hypothetical protein [Xanthomonadales bacterium]
MESKPLMIIIAGVVGGLGAWVWARTVGPDPLISETIFAVPAYMFLGGIAGYLGVYLIAKTDPAQTGHAIAFSLACGIFWGPVISGAEAVVNRAQVEQKAQALAVQQVGLVRAQGELSAQAQALQQELARATARATELDRAHRILLEQAQGGADGSRPTVRARLDELDTARVRTELQASAANVERLHRQLDRIVVER